MGKIGLPDIIIHQLTGLPVYQLQIKESAGRQLRSYRVYRITFKIQIRNMKFEIQDI